MEISLVLEKLKWFPQNSSLQFSDYGLFVCLTGYLDEENRPPCYEITYTLKEAELPWIKNQKWLEAAKERYTIQMAKRRKMLDDRTEF